MNRGQRAVRAVEHGFDHFFSVAQNPLRQLGALAFWLLWIVVASGFWIYAVYDTSVDGAWRSVQAMGDEQPWGAGLMRSLHRYASFAFVLVSVVHLVREWLLGRYRDARWFTWVSGVPLLWLMVASAIVGYWMVWDLRAQYVGITTLEWTAALPGVPLEVARNFLEPEAITDRFFSLLAFLHIGLPLVLLLGAWVHLLRLARPHTQPRRWLASGTLAVLVLGSLAWPATSMPAADLTRVPTVVDLDWSTLGVLPAAEHWPEVTWLVLAAGTAALVALPWLPRLASGPESHPTSPAGGSGAPRRRIRMRPVLRWSGQAVLYLLFALFIGYFSFRPAYRVLEPGHGLLRLSFSAPGKISADCRKRTPEELAKLPPQMRQAEECQRARSPVHARIELDGRVLIDRDFQPAGLSKDGASSGYWRTSVPVGSHQLKVVFRDDAREGAPLHERSETVAIAEGQIVLVDFKPDKGGVVIR